MKQLLFSILFFIYSFNSIANPQDSIRTEQKNGKSFILHKVSIGETLRQIAKKYKTTIRQIIAYNANLDSNFVKIGQTIYVLNSVQTDLKTEFKKQAQNNPINNPITNTQNNKSKPTIHIVESGESIIKIANLYKKNVDSLLIWNNLDRNAILGLQQHIIVGYDKSKGIITESMMSKMVATVNPKKVVHEIGKGERIATNSTSSFVLHRTFPVGSMVLLVNPTNRITTQAKVIGKIPNIDSNKEIIIKISEAACKELFIVNDKFAIEVVYEKIEK